MIIATARDAANLFEPLFEDASEEKVAVAHLDGKRALLAMGEEIPGGGDAVDLPIRSIIAEALRLGSTGMILAHNHPSGDPQPSRADIEATRRLASTAAEVGIQLHDHLIFAGGECRSLRALGLL